MPASGILYKGQPSPQCPCSAVDHAIRMRSLTRTASVGAQQAGFLEVTCRDVPHSDQHEQRQENSDGVTVGYIAFMNQEVLHHQQNRSGCPCKGGAVLLHDQPPPVELHSLERRFETSEVGQK